MPAKKKKKSTQLSITAPTLDPPGAEQLALVASTQGSCACVSWALLHPRFSMARPSVGSGPQLCGGVTQQGQTFPTFPDAFG